MPKKQEAPVDGVTVSRDVRQAGTEEEVSLEEQAGHVRAKETIEDVGFQAQPEELRSSSSRWRVASFNPSKVLPEVLQTVGQTVMTASQNIESGSRRLRSAVPDVGGLIPRAQQVREAGEALLRTPTQVGSAVGNLGGHLNELSHEGRKVLDKVAERDLPGALRSARDLVGKGVGTLVDYGSTVAGVVVEKVDFNKQIDNLRDGDRYTISVGGDLHTTKERALGAKGEADGFIEIQRLGERYVVAVDGQLAASIHPSGGLRKGLTAQVGVDAKIGAGVKLEMTFDTPDEAKRATRSLLQLSMMAGAGVASGVGGGVLGGAIALPLGALLSPSEEDIQGMRERISALEIRGLVAGQLGSNLGLGVSNVDLAGLVGELDAGTEVALRVEVPPDERPAVLLRQTLQLGAGTHVKAGISMTSNSGAGREMIDPEFEPRENSIGPGGVDLTAGLGAGLQGHVSVETGVQLPDSVPTYQLIKEPLQTLRGLVGDVLEVIPARLSGVVRAGGLLFTRKTGLEAKFLVEGEVVTLLRSGVFQQLRERDFRQALQTLGELLHLRAQVRPYELSGHSLHPTFKMGGIGVGVQGGLTSVDYEPPIWEYQGPVASWTDDVEERWNQAWSRLREQARELSLEAEPLDQGDQAKDG
ncbi:MAG: hypothetical protein EP343_15915 [Deltaproteobacteria bacterium]|nr:MAG: hypothetical protein EP343_15915 [Deltaproteobacteria bacterium]